jgi:D-tyrosyl-tRNA(Tyr) deacylase
MRAIVQRCASASVTVEDRLVSKVGRGLCVLIGIHRDDTAADAAEMVRRILALQIFPTADAAAVADTSSVVASSSSTSAPKVSVVDAGGEILFVSQFTLYAVSDASALRLCRGLLWM